MAHLGADRERMFLLSIGTNNEIGTGATRGKLGSGCSRRGLQLLFKPQRVEHRRIFFEIHSCSGRRPSQICSAVEGRACRYPRMPLRSHVWPSF